jgi:hypothetical protein
MKFRKRYRSGLQMLAAYTWSKMLDDFSSVGGYGITYPGYTNNNQRRLDKALSSLDQARITWWSTSSTICRSIRTPSCCAA